MTCVTQLFLKSWNKSVSAVITVSIAVISACFAAFDSVSVLGVVTLAAVFALIGFYFFSISNNHAKAHRIWNYSIAKKPRIDLKIIPQYKSLLIQFIFQYFYQHDEIFTIPLPSENFAGYHGKEVTENLYEEWFELKNSLTL